MEFRRLTKSTQRSLCDAYMGLLDLVFPPFCLTCGTASEEYLCAECVDKILLIEPPACARCGSPAPTYPCPNCEGLSFSFDSAHCAGIYEGVLREAIHAFKYGCCEALSETLGGIMSSRIPARFLEGRIDCVVPLPIHRSRMLVRGFNQSELLARRVCSDTGLELALDVLYQKRKTPHQVNLPQEKRLGNVRNAFAVRNAGKIAGKRVLLVDDVLTTGSTLNEAALAMKNAGASSVHAYTLARSA